jgi:hypothetical protein
MIISIYMYKLSIIWDKHMIYTTYEIYECSKWNMSCMNETLLVQHMKHLLCNIWNITYATYETSLMQHMEHYLRNIRNITYATYETSLMQHSKCKSHAHSHEWMSDAYAHAMQVHKCKLNTRVLHARPIFFKHFPFWHQRLYSRGGNKLLCP